MKGFVKGMLLGMAAGAAVGMVISPMTDKEMRKLRKKADQAVKAIEDLVAETGAKLRG